jgi:hypothetical protein
MMLYIRMALYALFALLAGQGLILYDHEAGTVTFRVEDLALLASGAVGYVGTFVAGRVAKSHGGKT